jgi:antitoxin CptB
MKELDQLLTRFLNERYPSAHADEKAAFRELLELPDPELAGYFLGRMVAEDPRIANVVARVLGEP